jgi:sugar O-acyltransferase (sialic acid O-acetyltransferase NeuD family)
MIEDLVVVGAGGNSRNIVLLVEDINQVEPRWNLLGYLDDDPAIRGRTVGGYPVLGPLALCGSFPACKFIIGVANYKNRLVRKAIVERMGFGPERFATLVHPSASVSRNATVGAGTVIFQYVVVGSNVAIGSHVVISQLSTIGHDSQVDDYVTAAAGVLVSGSVRVGTGAYLGTGCHIIQEVSIGEDALAGIGSVVLRDVPPHTTVLGNPAKPRRIGKHAAP